MERDVQVSMSNKSGQISTIGTILRGLREEAGISQNKLARLARMDPTAYNRIERSLSIHPRSETILRIIQALGLTVEDERVRLLLQHFNQTLTEPSMHTVRVQQHTISG